MFSVTIVNPSPHVLDTLNAAGIRYTLDDPADAIESERKRGAKFRPGSPKHAAHLDRLKRLEQECSLSNTNPSIGASISVRAASSTSIFNEENIAVSRVCDSKKSLSSPLTSEQELAVGALMTLNTVSRTVAEKAVRQAGEGAAQDVIARALPYLE